MTNTIITEEPIRPNQKRAKMAWTMIYAVMIASAILIVENILVLYNAIIQSQGNELPLEILSGINIFSAFAIFGYYGVYIISIVTFILWFRRAYYNMNLISNSMSYPDIYAGWAWFIPIMNLFRPYRMMKEIHEHAKYILDDCKLLNPVQIKLNYVSTWWTFWIITNIAKNIFQKINEKSFTAEDQLFTVSLIIIANATFVYVGYLAVRMIKTYSAAEDQFEELYGRHEDEHQPTSSDASFYE